VLIPVRRPGWKTINVDSSLLAEIIDFSTRLSMNLRMSFAGAAMFMLAKGECSV